MLLDPWLTSNIFLSLLSYLFSGLMELAPQGHGQQEDPRETLGASVVAFSCFVAHTPLLRCGQVGGEAAAGSLYRSILALVLLWRCLGWVREAGW